MKPAGSSVKPPTKRRRLDRNQTRGPGAPTPTSTIATKTQGSAANTSKAGTPICATCHRALQSTTAGCVIQCAICHSTTCAICSRTCTNSAASQPPTPRLTWSPSPSPMPSPRRSVLALNSSNANLLLLDPTGGSAQHTSGANRRKHPDDGEDDVTDTKIALGEYQGEFGPGCGKLVCRNCCYEDAHNNTTTCLQCYGSCP